MCGECNKHNWINKRVNRDVCECVGQYTGYVSLLYPLRDRNNDTPVTFSMPAVSRSWFLCTVLPKKRTPGSLGNCLIPVLRQRNQEMNAEHLQVPGSKEILETEEEKKQGRGHVTRAQSSQWPEEKQLKQLNK